MFEDRTAEQIKRELVAAVAANTGLTGEDGGFLDHLLGPVALELWSYYQSLDAAIPVAFVDEGSGEYIDRRCAEYGISRKAGTRAVADMALTGQAGTLVPTGTAFLTASGLEYDLVSDVTLTGASDSGKVVAVAVGAAYNVEAGAISGMVVTLPGLDRWTNAPALGGTDPESDGALVGRLNDFLRRPATSGNVYHYEQWARETEGVGGAKVSPRWAGPGTVKVLVVGPEMEPVDAAVVDACAKHIEAERPIGAAVTVCSAQGLPIDVSATVTIESSTTIQAVQAALQARLGEYIRSIAFVSYKLLYNRVAYLLLGIDGMHDYTALTVNGGVVDVAIGADQVPVLGEVTISCG